MTFRIHIVCYEGAASSSNGRLDLSKSVKCVAQEFNCEIVFHIFPKASTAKLRAQSLKVRSEMSPRDGLICVGKSLGAIRMFRILNEGIIHPDRVVSIDPQNFFRLFYCKPVSIIPSLVSITENVYQDGWRSGSEVSGITNYCVKGVTHKTITSCITTKALIHSAITLVREALQNEN